VDTLLELVTNPDIIAYAFLFFMVMADCLRHPLALDVCRINSDNCRKYGDITIQTHQLGRFSVRRIPARRTCSAADAS